MDILFIIDRVELKYFEFNNLVTNFWFIKEFLARGQNVFITTIDKLSLKNGVACASCANAYAKGEDIFYEKTFLNREIEEFQLVMFRQDPPVDADYINSTYIFDFVSREKTLIINEPSAVRDFNEKLHAVKFKQFMPENIVTASKVDILEFLNEHDEIVLKPLGACFGSGVMTLKKGDKNTSVIINSVTNNGTKLIMVQKYLSKAVHGDKRVLFLGEEVLDVCVQKLPSNDDFKFNEHTDANIVRAQLSEQEKEDFTQVAREMNKLGILLVGLDVIDGKIIEINVTSPCYFIKEINQHFGVELEKRIVDFILSKVPVALTV